MIRSMNGASKLKSWDHLQNVNHILLPLLFVHGIISGWTLLMRMVPLSSDQLKPLEDVIRHQFIPAISRRHTVTDEERDLLSLPIRDGGMGIPIPYQISLPYSITIDLCSSSKNSDEPTACACSQHSTRVCQQ